MENTIGINIKKYRKEKDLTQQELSTKTNLSRVAIGNYERGDRIPNAQTLKLIADALKVSTEDLLGDRNTPDTQCIKEVAAMEGLVELIKYSGHNYHFEYEGNEGDYLVTISNKDYTLSLSRSEFESLFHDTLSHIQFELFKRSKE